MRETLLFCAVLGLGVGILALELRRARPGTDRGAWALLGGIALAALSPSLGLLDARSLPVQPPAEPWHDPAGCGGVDGLGALGVAALIALYLVVRGVVPASLMLVGRGQRRPTGNAAVTIATIAFAVAAAVTTLRLAACGAPDAAFTTYGAITPAGATGWRVDAALDAALEPRRAIARGAAIASEVVELPRSHWSVGSTTVRPGLHAWVAGAPVLFERVDGAVVGTPVERREVIPPARRPHYRTWPEVARLDDDHLVIVGIGDDGGWLAVKVDDVSLQAAGATTDDVAWLARPRRWPYVVAMVLGAIGLAIARRARRTDAAWTRVLAAWFLVEATAVLSYAYSGYLLPP